LGVCRLHLFAPFSPWESLTATTSPCSKVFSLRKTMSALPRCPFLPIVAPPFSLIHVPPTPSFSSGAPAFVYPGSYFLVWVLRSPNLHACHFPPIRQKLSLPLLTPTQLPHIDGVQFKCPPFFLVHLRHPPFGSLSEFLCLCFFKTPHTRAAFLPRPFHDSLLSFFSFLPLFVLAFFFSPCSLFWLGRFRMVCCPPFFMRWSLTLTIFFYHNRWGLLFPHFH